MTKKKVVVVKNVQITAVSGTPKDDPLGRIRLRMIIDHWRELAQKRKEQISARTRTNITKQ
jgi:hypothetical protein